MAPPLRNALFRAARPSSPFTHHTRAQLRRYSQQPSQTSSFYKTFSRPVAKCALLAVLVYQLVYFGWAKLEADDVKEERQAEIVRLEAQVKGLQAAAAAAAAAGTDGGAAASSRGDEHSRQGGAVRCGYRYSICITSRHVGM
ncbi:hypothetical protein BT67DRAFT_453890 [Trichocladium antarcticum]|uniref:Uncharacterized protein n=1 Tax=Trichocladium antarcticum TaxID=1450529 RepID=A0AAN6ZFV2_9PEZI|nr:hypothetical protein BT67DRAFT_453890 [Trichocladium antarcticum]